MLIVVVSLKADDSVAVLLSTKYVEMSAEEIVASIAVVTESL